MSVAYVDASALTKLLLDEPGSAAMYRWYIEANRITSSVIGVIETRRAVARHSDRLPLLDEIFGSLVVIDVDRTIAAMAAAMKPVTLRTLDAIHLATANVLAGQLDAFITYDDRLAEAARMAGLPVVRPA